MQNGKAVVARDGCDPIEWSAARSPPARKLGKCPREPDLTAMAVIGSIINPATGRLYGRSGGGSTKCADEIVAMLARPIVTPAPFPEGQPMTLSPTGLLKTRRLWPLAVAQSCGALNDNLVKNAMIVLAIFTLGIGGAGLSALAGALFIAPYILLSANAGTIADRLSKPRLIAAYKAAEVVLMVGAATAFLAQSVPRLLAVLFGLGVQAALFGPVKYGVLPELLREDELVAGNGIIEATTFLSIVIGTVTGGAHPAR